jgi:hypothetical protein
LNRVFSSCTSIFETKQIIIIRRDQTYLFQIAGDKEQDMTDEHGSKYGKGFAFRMTILVGLLALVGAGLFYDRYILPSMAKATIEEAYKLMTAPDEDGHGISKDLVQKTIGFAPESITKQDQYDIETYSFKRALPFMKGDYLNVIYENGALIQILQNQDYSPEKVESALTARGADPSTYTGNKPVLGGVPPSSVPEANRPETDDDSDDEAEEEADDEGGEKADDDGDEKADEDNADEESEDEEKETEEKKDPGKKGDG